MLHFQCLILRIYCRKVWGVSCCFQGIWQFCLQCVRNLALQKQKQTSKSLHSVLKGNQYNACDVCVCVCVCVCSQLSDFRHLWNCGRFTAKLSEAYWNVSSFLFHVHYGADLSPGLKRSGRIAQYTLSFCALYLFVQYTPHPIRFQGVHRNKLHF